MPLLSFVYIPEQKWNERAGSGVQGGCVCAWMEGGGEGKRRQMTDVTRRRTSADSSPSITAPLVSTWMTFGVGSVVDMAILLRTVDVGQGRGKQ